MRTRCFHRAAALGLSCGWDGVRLALAGGYLSAVVGLPPAVGLLSEPTGWLRPSVEVAALAAVLATLAALGRPLGRRTHAALAVALLLVTLLAGADLLVRAVYDRPLNLALDVVYVPFLAGFLVESAGAAKVAAAAVAVAAGAAVLLAGNLWALRTLDAVVAAGARGRAALIGLAVLVLAVQAARAGPGVGCPAGSGLACRPWQLVSDQVRHAADFWRPLPGLDGPDPYAAAVAAAPGRLAEGLGGADVVIAFVESYGETALRRRAYADVVGPALAGIEARLAAAGLGAVSGYLVSPTVGGLSWLAHGTLLSGVWLPNDLYYKRLTKSDRTTLVEDFNRAGYRTLGVFPQMNGAWPEGRFFRHDEVYTAREIPYDGPPFGWMTMPDQYSLWFAEQQRRRGGGEGTARPPVFVELALISSHAPWEPIPPLVEDWAELGTAGGADAFLGHGGPGGPKNWPHDAPANYPKAVAYSLRALGSYAATFLAGDDEGGGGNDALLVVVGDHQPASLITGEGAPRTVPIHVIARNQALLEPFRAWGFTDGMIPGDGAARHRMDEFRGRFLDAFGGGRGGTNVATAGGAAERGPGEPAP